jgi:clan AA aspartic protease (TIGR02281 family)
LAREVVLTRGSSGHFFLSAKVNGKPGVRFIVDTGASIVALPVEDARKIRMTVDSFKFEIIGESASGVVRGQRVIFETIGIDGIHA